MANYARKYFAAEDPDKIGQCLWRKVEESESWSNTSEIHARWEKAYLYYFGMEYGGIHATSRVQRGGDQGELAEIRVNHSRALAQTLFNLIAASKVVWSPVAVNSDYSAASQATLAQNILEYFWHDRRVSQYCQRSLEEAIPFCESFVLTEWDETAGEPALVDEQGQVVKTGDIRFTNVMPWDAIRDPRKRSYEGLDWIIIRLRRNRYDLAAQCPELEEEIMKAAPATSAQRRLRIAVNGGIPDESQPDDCDVDYYCFFHKPTPTLPQGRETHYVSAKGVLRDGPLSYTVWPVHRVHHSELFGTPYAYSPYLEILGVQELMDSLETSIATNQSTFATQNILLQRGSSIEPDQLSGGLKVIYYDDKEPKALNLTHSPPEVFAHLQTKKKDIEQLMGLNSVVRGEPLTGDQSGAALALLQAQAVQQSSGLQANYLRFVEGIGNAVLELMRTRCPTPRRIAITGKATSFMQREQEFTGESIGQIRKVRVEIGNPLSQTVAGRIGLAKEMMANGLIKTPEQYVQVIQTGRVDPLTQSTQNELMLILKENEQILDGQVPQISADDDDPLHAREHRGVMANPDARRDPNVVAAYQQHIQDHEMNWTTKSPVRAIMMGQQPPPQMGPPGMPPGAPPPGPPPPEGPPPGPEGAATPPGMGEQAGLPAMPTDPSTGMPAPTPDGATLSRPGANSGPKGPGGGPS